MREYLYISGLSSLILAMSLHIYDGTLTSWVRIATSYGVFCMYTNSKVKINRVL